MIHTVDTMRAERDAAMAQTARVRRQLARALGGLRWMAQRPCRHERDGGVCLTCYSRAVMDAVMEREPVTAAEASHG